MCNMECCSLLSLGSALGPNPQSRSIFFPGSIQPE